MAEAFRCGRRKQRNPRRKNDENPLDTTSKLAVDVPLQEPDDDDVTEPETDSCQGDKASRGSVHGDVSVQGDVSDTETSQKSSPNDVSDKDVDKGDDVTPVITPQGDVTSEVEPDVKDKAMAGLAEPSPGCHANRTAGGLTEDDRIQELLNRSDTAVIFPEPVSDHDDDSHGNQDTNSTSKQNGVLSNSSDVHSNHNDDADSEVSGGDGEYMLRCPHCSKGFTRTYLLQEHIRSSHGDKVNKHPCPKCEESFALKSQLDKHIALHSSTSQICTICNKTFANVYRLQRHMISHDESTDLRKFKCPECQKAFKFKHHLKEHIRIHSGEKPFECSNCGKRFSHSGSYSSHMTSKKCWVVNLRMKKPDKQVASSEEAHPPSSEERRPLAPKGAEENNAADLSLHGMYAASQFRPFLHMDPAMTAQYLATAQLQQPFLPYAGFPGHMMNHPMMGGLAGSPYGFALLSGKKDSAQKAARTKLEDGEMVEGMPPPHKSMKLETVPVKEEQQADENQNTQTDPAAALEEAVTEDTPLTNHPEIKKEALEEHEVAEKAEDNTENKEEPQSEEEKHMDQEGVPAGNPTANMNEIKKVLDIVGNTVTQQKQQQVDDKSAISKLSHSEESSGKKEEEQLAASGQSDVESSQGEEKDSLPCRYCQDMFSSPVDLHQHERYLCKQNSEIRPSDSSPPRQADPSSPTPQQPQTPTSLNHSTEPLNVMSPGGLSHAELEKGSEDENSASQNESDGFIDKEGRQYRVRSMLTDDQQRILKAHYAVNPRPNKFELLQIANAVSFPKRVVQVWFQNMRARDRRRGNTIPAPVSSTAGTTSVATAALLAGSEKLSNGSSAAWSAKTTTPTTTAPYIPVVPQLPFSMITGGTNVVYPYSSPAAHPKLNGQRSSSSSSGSPHTPTPSPANLAFTMQVEPLDLSTKKSPSTSLSSSGSPPMTPRSVPNGDGEEEEGGVLNLSKRSHSPRVADIPSLEKTLENSPIFKYMQQEGMIQNGGHTNSNSDGNASSHSNRSTPNLLHPPLVRPGFVDTQLPTESAVFPVPATTQVGSPLLHRSSPVLAVGSPSMSPPSSLESSFNSTMSLDSSGLENGLTRKRSRKKSWRQMESEQVALEFNDALMIDEDNLSRNKKRKSWKAHKVDVEEGMYACDQCDKLFNKQSSLARHKYEHSGARPFSCGECGKAFKHKHHLTEHRRLHSGEKPFVCTKCGKRFSHSGSFSQHMNHRYKYCKPLRGASGASENESGSENGSEAAAMADAMEN